jgi:hypothetical protein
MLIQKLNAFNTQRYQARGINNNPQQPSYMSNVRGNLKQDTVSFRMNLEPKLLSAEVNQLLGKAIAKLESEQKSILESVNAPIKALRERVGVSNYNIPLVEPYTVEQLMLTKSFDDGTVIKFSKKFDNLIKQEVVFIESTDRDYMNVIKIQENCFEQMMAGGGKGVIINNAFTNVDTTPAQRNSLRFNSYKEENVTDPSKSKGIKILNQDITTLLTKLLGE